MILDPPELVTDLLALSLQFESSLLGALFLMALMTDWLEVRDRVIVPSVLVVNLGGDDLASRSAHQALAPLEPKYLLPGSFPFGRRREAISPVGIRPSRHGGQRLPPGVIALGHVSSLLPGADATVASEIRCREPEGKSLYKA